MYKHILKPILFRFNPETAHNMIMSTLTFLRHIPFAGAIMRSIYKKETPTLEKEVFGITFPNPVGLAGGLDKNGEHYNDMANFGFGFVDGQLLAGPLFVQEGETFVQGYPVEPGRHLGIASEVFDVGPCLDEGVLQYVVGIIVGEHQAADLPV
jgi:hypothetical protein